MFGNLVMCQYKSVAKANDEMKYNNWINELFNILQVTCIISQLQYQATVGTVKLCNCVEANSKGCNHEAF